MPIKRPQEIVKTQIEYQEERIPKIMAHIESKINEHLEKIPENEYCYDIKVQMGELGPDTEAFWDDADLEKMITESVSLGGWKVLSVLKEEGMGTLIIVKFSVDPERGALEELEGLREKTREEFKISRKKRIAFSRS